MGLFSIFKKGSAPAYSCYRYKVTGINPASGRKKNVFVIAASNAAPEAVASKSGLLEIRNYFVLFICPASWKVGLFYVQKNILKK